MTTPRHASVSCPTVQDDDGTFVAYRDTGDRELRDQLVRRHLGLAHAMAERYTSRGIPRDDLRQVAALGLLKAVDRFDPARGVAFSSFAVPTILGELRRHFRDAAWTIRVPRRLQDLRLQADAAMTRLEQRLQRRPTLAETAAELQEDPHSVLLALDGLRSCYRPAPLEGVEGHADHLDEDWDRVTDELAVQDLLARLPCRQQQILVLRYWSGLTQREIAAHMGISQMHVSRLIRSGIAGMRSGTDDADVSDAGLTGTLTS